MGRVELRVVSKDLALDLDELAEVMAGQEKRPVCRQKHERRHHQRERDLHERVHPFVAAEVGQLDRPVAG